MEKKPAIGPEELEKFLPKQPFQEKVVPYERPSREKRHDHWAWILLCISTALNTVLLIHCSLEKASPYTFLTPHECSTLYTSPYSGLSFDTSVTHMTESDYVSENETLADEMWDKVVNLLAIQVSDTYVKQKGLAPSWPFPWDLDKRVYFPKVGHQLHCLKVMRRAFHETRRTGRTSIAARHVDHCLNSLRQDLMCYADDTPMATRQPLHGLGSSQPMQCKNWDKVLEWIFADERHACYKHINSWTGSRDLIERYAFCPEDSIYFPIMQSYFELHGHGEKINDLG